jgi:hypothetical protein
MQGTRRRALLGGNELLKLGQGSLFGGKWPVGWVVSYLLVVLNESKRIVSHQSLPFRTPWSRADPLCDGSTVQAVTRPST